MSSQRAPKDAPEIGLSSLDDELSNSQVLRVGQNSSQNKALLMYSSVNDEYANVSEAGLAELSIVESIEGGETPAAHFKKNSFGNNFGHYMKPIQRESKETRESKSSTNLKRKESKDGRSESENKELKSPAEKRKEAIK